MKHITVRGSAVHMKQLAKQNVETMLDAQFSLPYSIATTLVSGGAMLDQYTAAALKRPEVLELARRVQMKLEPSVTDGEEPYIDVALNDGRTLTDRVLIARGDCENPLPDDELRGKFRTAAAGSLNEKQIERLESAILRASELTDSRELVELMMP